MLQVAWGAWVEGWMGMSVVDADTTGLKVLRAERAVVAWAEEEQAERARAARVEAEETVVEAEAA